MICVAGNEKKKESLPSSLYFLKYKIVVLEDKEDLT